MTPDFAQWLLATFPEAERVGRVFKLNAPGTSVALTTHSVGRVIVEIGEKPGYIVNAVERKTASAHDLRRAFATR